MKITQGHFMELNILEYTGEGYVWTKQCAQSLQTSIQGNSIDNKGDNILTKK